MRKLIGSIIFCIAGALLNMIVYWIFITIMGLPLYLDTIFTITVTLLYGPLWGSITGALTNITSVSVYGLEYYLFALCNVAAAIVTWLFMRLFPRELNLSFGANSARTEGIITAKPFYQAGSSRLSIRLSVRLGAVMDRVIVLTILSFTLCLAMSILGGCISVFIGFFKATAVNPAAVPTMFNRNIPILLNEILSRVPINIIDRLISAFAAFCVALGVHYLMQREIKT